MNPEPISDEYEPRRSWWSKLRDGIFGADESEEEGMENHAVVSTNTSLNTGQAQKPGQALRIHTARGGRVAIRLNAQVMEDAKLAADGLKAGEHQIVNLEKASPQMGERIIDFLNGVCYALDGSVERVGDKVFMYVPANVTVEVDNGATGAANGNRVVAPFRE
ncbi:MAG: cell division protein SepF [Chthonomonadaceae bacterium]|nr:cell division protein SepF [Chthonomonadaceae bacterium]